MERFLDKQTYLWSASQNENILALLLGKIAEHPSMRRIFQVALRE
ncbi:hypothetical protein [Dapis sp. BLCC M229]